MGKVASRGLLQVYREFTERSKQHFLTLAEQSNNAYWNRYAQKMRAKENTGEEIVND